MDPKALLKTAQERMVELENQRQELIKQGAEKDAKLEDALKKVAYYEREKQVDRVLDILIDEKRYFPEAQRQEKKAYLMDEKTDIDTYMKIAGELNPREPGMFYKPSSSAKEPANRDDAFINTFMNKLAGAMYGN